MINLLTVQEVLTYLYCNFLYGWGKTFYEACLNWDVPLIVDADGLASDHGEPDAALRELGTFRMDIRGTRSTEGSSQSPRNVDQAWPFLPELRRR